MCTLSNLITLRYGYLNVIKCKDITQALTALKKFNPHIIILNIDIKDIEWTYFLQEVRSKYLFRPKVIVTTSRSSFELAQKVIKQRVEDFLLKPISKEQLEGSIERIVKLIKIELNDELLFKDIQNMMKEINTRTISSIISVKDQAIIDNVFYMLNFEVESGLFIVFNDYKLNKDKIEDVINNFKNKYILCDCDLDSSKVVLILFNQIVYDIPQDIYDLRCCFNEDMVHIGSVENKYSLYLSYKKATNYKDSLLEIVTSSNSDSIVYNDFIVFSIIQNIYCKDIKEIDTVLKDYYFYLHKNYTNKEIYVQIDKLVNKLNESVFKYFKYKSKIKILSEKFYEDEFIYEVLDYCNTIIIYNSNNCNILIDEACNYVKSNFSKKITLNNVAECLGVSYYYISKVLSGEANIKFSEMLNNLRVQEAIKQLKTNKRIKEIAIDLGFQSQNYFTKVFKKVIGITPVEFRIQMYR